MLEFANLFGCEKSLLFLTLVVIQSLSRFNLAISWAKKRLSAQVENAEKGTWGNTMKEKELLKKKLPLEEEGKSFSFSCLLGFQKSSVQIVCLLF